MHHLLCWCSRDCCTPWKCTNRAEMHHLLCWCSRDCCTPWKCTNRARTAPFTLLVQQRLLHPLEVHQPRKNCTIYFVGAAETAAPPGRHQSSKHCTNRANHKRLCWGAWVWQGCHTLLQLLALMRFEPVLAPTRVSHERHVQRIGVLHFFDNNLFYTLLLLRQDGEVEFVVHLQNHL